MDRGKNPKLVMKPRSTHAFSPAEKRFSGSSLVPRPSFHLETYVAHRIKLFNMQYWKAGNGPVDEAIYTSGGADGQRS